MPTWIGALIGAIAKLIPYLMMWRGGKRSAQADAAEKGAENARRANEIDESIDDLTPDERERWLRKGDSGE